MGKKRREREARARDEAILGRFVARVRHGTRDAIGMRELPAGGMTIDGYAAMLRDHYGEPQGTPPLVAGAYQAAFHEVEPRRRGYDGFDRSVTTLDDLAALYQNFYSRLYAGRP